MTRRRWRDRRFLTLAVVVLGIPAASRELVAKFSSPDDFELLAYDWHCRALPPREPDPRIVIVGMDNESLGRLPLLRRSYPLPRNFHAKVIDELRNAGARVVGFDVMFTRSVPAEDDAFAAAMRRIGLAGK